MLTAVADGLAQAGTPKTVEELEADLANQRYSPYVPVPVADNVPEDLKIWIDEHSAELPGVAAERVAVRHYPYGRLAAHVLGYTGQIIDDEFEEKAGSDKPYTLNDKIGKYGVEKIYEDDLRGTPGSRSIEVDAENQPIRVVEQKAPIPGDDIVLNLDIDVQAQAEQALQSGLAIAKERPCTGCKVEPKAEVGSTVVLDPEDGRGAGHGVVPVVQPGRLRRRHQRRRVGAADGGGEQRPAQQLGDPGPVRARFHLQALQRRLGARGGPHHARHHRVRRRHLRGARLRR